MSRLLLFFLLLSIGFLHAQENEPSFIDVQYFSGTLLRHNKNIANLVREHPTGFVLSYNRKTYGKKRWQREYNYPDWGLSFLYEDFNYDVLGKNYGLYLHYNFYFLNRHLQFRIAEGVAYNTNPFDIDTNFKNIAYGSSFLASTYLLLNYNQANVFRGVGVQGGIGFVHHSNGSFKAPNSGSNAFSVQLGLQYHLDQGAPSVYEDQEIDLKYSEKIKYNFVVRASYNEGDYYNLGQHPYIVLSAFADKRFSFKNTIQFGAEVFFAKFLEKEIEYVSIAFPASKTTGEEDYKRVSLFLGHEFRLDKLGLVTQVGYYVYYPYEYETRMYSRVGVKYYFNEKLFVVGTVKTHAANAEALAFGLGVRL